MSISFYSRMDAEDKAYALSRPGNTYSVYEDTDEDGRNYVIVRGVRQPEHGKLVARYLNGKEITQ